MKYILFTLLFAATAFSQNSLHPAVKAGRNIKDSTLILWKAGTKQDSLNVQSRVALGMLRFTVKNNSATDTLRIAFCQSWADTANFTDIEPSETFNYSARDATWVRFLAFAASDTITRRKVRFY